MHTQAFSPSLSKSTALFFQYFSIISNEGTGPDKVIKSLLVTDLFLAISVKFGGIWGLQMEEQQSRRSHLPYFFLKNKKNKNKPIRLKCKFPPFLHHSIFYQVQLQLKMKLFPWAQHDLRFMVNQKYSS